MKVFCDTNVLVAAFSEGHPHYSAARPVLERVMAGRDQGFVAAHSLAEAYAVMTRLPAGDQVAPAIAWQLLSENIIKHFAVVHLTGREYVGALEAAAAMGVQGGMTYDAILLAAAGKSGAERIYSFNLDHFQNLAPAGWRERICSP